MEKTNKFVDPSDPYFSHGNQKTRLKAFGSFIYNPEKGSFLGRTCSSWAKILTFYVIFYSCLIAFFAVCMWGMMQTIDLNEPKYQLDRSIIGASPGLASRPIPEAGRDAVLQFSSELGSWWGWETMLLDEFLQEYQTSTNANQCNYTHHSIPCAVDVEDWESCKPNGTRLNSYCMFFKLNKLYGWTAEYYKDINNLPSEMPSQLKEEIANTSALERQKIWLSCEGHHDIDKNNIGEVKYYPEQGFPGYFYPFKGQKGFRSPVVAVHFVNPTKDTEINVECRSWGPAIIHDRKEQLGVLNFRMKFN